MEEKQDIGSPNNHSKFETGGDSFLILLKVAMKEKEKELVKYKKKFNIQFPILIDKDASVKDA